MPRYKRDAAAAELDAPVSTDPERAPEDVATLTQLRNMWQFASLMQYIFLFGHAVKIDDDFDIEDLEAECLRPTPSERLPAIGLAMLKLVSSHRGLTPEIFDEYTRRQYMAKAPARNPFGEDEEPRKFNDLDIYTRIKVLQQLSTWTFGNVDRMRNMMPPDEDDMAWRMEPLGWDKDDRAYFVLDDNRLYRRSDEPLLPPTPPPKPKAKSKAKKSTRSRGTRSSKRRKVEESEEDEPQDATEDAGAGAEDDTIMGNGGEAHQEEEPGYGFTNKTWECVAITLEEYNDFLASIFRSRDPNEKQLRKRIEEDVLPVIEKRAEAIRQKQLKKQRDLENLQKMATAKRSSRLAGKAEKEKEEREKREEEEKRLADLRMAHEEEERQKRIEEGHESRRLTREQRLKEREVKRILHEEELKKIQEQEERATSQDANGESTAEDAKRVSARQAQTQKAEHKKHLQQLAEEEGKWYFDCSVCGVNGENVDDGTHSLACDRCGVWQHSKCHGFSPKQAEGDGFNFICNSCKRQEEEAKKPKIPPLKLGKKASSGSPEAQKSETRPSSATSPSAKRDSGLPPHVQRQLDNMQTTSDRPGPSPGPFGQITHGPSLSPHAQQQGPPGYRYPPDGNFAQHPPQQPWQGSPLPPPNRPSSGYSGAPTPPTANGHGSPPHHQQHQYAHQHAVSGTGAHPGYYPPPMQYPQQPNGFGPGPAYPGHYGASQPSAGQQYPPPHTYMQQAPPHFPQPPPQQYFAPPQQPQQQRPSSGQLMKGFSSPVKGTAPPPASSPPQGSAPPAALSPSLRHSPKTTFAPPSNTYAQAAPSPVKSSPPQHPQQPMRRPSLHSPSVAQTPEGLRRPSSNGTQPPTFSTPQAQLQPTSANANGVAADGMAGPWPEGSKAIPQKHDQSPAPPSSAVSETKVMPPPMGALQPSPSQQPLPGAGTIPVKKPAPDATPDSG
ncbi:hypothetical protein KC351_g5337 [Hortaea werneckii]|nr:hypothetical protein KC351_g5337 [Hortaea werneckii]